MIVDTITYVPFYSNNLHFALLTQLTMYI